MLQLRCAILWNDCVAVALRRYFVAVYCGAVVLVCILHSGVLAVFMFLRNGILATFTFLHNGIRVCVFTQWYSSTNALKMQAFCFKWVDESNLFYKFCKN